MAARRDGPVYINLGDQQVLQRLEKPIQQRARKLYDRLYQHIKGPSFGQFLGFLVDVGLDEVERRTAGGAGRPARTHR